MKPWLLLPPRWAHDLSPLALPLYALTCGKKTPQWRSFTWRELSFKNPIGIAGGVDKNAENLKDWWSLGCGFVEIGTVTPKAQDPNPGKILDRDKLGFSLWNRMGFPSHGADEVFYNLTSYIPQFRTPVFVNIGKNRETPNEKALDDYIFLIDKFRPVADAFVINISSPNTTGLRDLQSKENLSKLIGPLVQKVSHYQPTPVLVKLSPDMNEETLAETVLHCHELGADGFVLTNTTLSRYDGCPYPSEGGMSGKPLQKLSQQSLTTAIRALGAKRQGKLIVSVGGIMTPEDAFERLSQGADLIQAYSALAFSGPQFFLDVASAWSKKNSQGSAHV